MFTEVLSAAIVGVDACLIHVEADVSDGLPCFNMVGYVNAQVREAQDRVRTAIRNVGLAMPPKRVTINLAPADIRKEGPGFDLPIATAILCAAGMIKKAPLKESLILGELGLDGRIQRVKGVLPSVIMAKEQGMRRCILPLGNLKEASWVEGIELVGVESLEDMLCYIRDPAHFQQKEPQEENLSQAEVPDFGDIRGQELVKRAAVISAAGFHNLLMIGPPGSGKTMTASRMPGIFPPMTLEETLEVTKIYSVAGLLSDNMAAISQRPFRAPHHTISPQALAGGGKSPRPGEITLAHKGVLFLDEFPEFSNRSIEILRQPMEDKCIRISRVEHNVTFPADFVLVAALNPCKCGYYPDMNRCKCTSHDIAAYLHRISQPLLDRMDLAVEVPAVTYEDLNDTGGAVMTTAMMREQVMGAVERQIRRCREDAFMYNSRLTAGDIKKYCPLDKETEDVLKSIYRKLNLSARSCHRLIRVSRTIADLQGSDCITKEHILEACCFRNVGKKFWGI